MSDFVSNRRRISCLNPEGWFRFVKLRHLCHNQHGSLSTKTCGYRAAIYYLLLYGYKTRPLRKKDIRELYMFDHICLHSIPDARWDC